MASSEINAAADALVTEVERLFALAIYHDPETQAYSGPIQLKAVPDLPPYEKWPPWAKYMRTGGYYGNGDVAEVGIDEWEREKRAQAENGEITWDEWLKHGEALRTACAHILALNKYAVESSWTTYVNVFKASVKRDVEAVVDAAGNAADKALNMLDWLPWVVGGVAVIVVGIAIWEYRRSVRTVSDQVSRGARVVGDEFELTAKDAGKVARRRLNA